MVETCHIPSQPAVEIGFAVFVLPLLWQIPNERGQVQVSVQSPRQSLSPDLGVEPLTLIGLISWQTRNALFFAIVNNDYFLRMDVLQPTLQFFFDRVIIGHLDAR